MSMKVNGVQNIRIGPHPALWHEGEQMITELQFLVAYPFEANTPGRKGKTFLIYYLAIYL